MLVPASTRSPSHPNSRHPSSPYFDEYIQQLPAWEKVLLLHITWEHNPFQSMQHIQQLAADEKLLIVSDGLSFELISMRFGVSIATSSGYHILSNKGPAYGKPSSHRAKCTGCLSGVLILKHWLLFTQLLFPPKLPVIAISDNAAMINSLTDQATYPNCYPNATPVADWDLLDINNTVSCLHSPTLTNGFEDTKTTVTAVLQVYCQLKQS
jgi:hypothetical protein